MSEQLKSSEQIRKFANGDLEVLLPLSNGTYQLEIVHSYGSEVYNPDDQISDLITKGIAIGSSRHKILFGTHLNGFCPENCYACPWSRSVMTKFYQNESNPVFKQASPIKPTELKEVLNMVKIIALEKGVIQPDEPLSAANFLAGDPGFSPHLSDLMAVVAACCTSSKWSTTAPETGFDVISALQTGIFKARQVDPCHEVSCQFSLHSTDPAARKAHVGYEHLKSFTQIADASAQLFSATNRRVTLAFVIHAASIIEPAELDRFFSPQHALISLRPLLSSNHPSMPVEDQLSLYHKLRSRGWDVVYIPVGSAELDNMRTHSGS